jgi:hypothetical protein
MLQTTLCNNVLLIKNGAKNEAKKLHYIWCPCDQKWCFGDFFTCSSGVEVTITNFCDFCQFLAKNIGVLLNQCNDQLFFTKNSSSFSKNAKFFGNFFGKNILKTITSVPGHPVRHLCYGIFIKMAGKGALCFEINQKNLINFELINLFCIVS